MGKRFGVPHLKGIQINSACGVRFVEVKISGGPNVLRVKMFRGYINLGAHIFGGFRLFGGSKML